MTDYLPLSQRVAAALTGSLSSADLAALIAEVSTEAGSLDARRAEAERVSLDPLATDEAVEAASANVVRLGLAARRQQTALQQLDARLVKVAAEESEAAARAIRDAAVKQRDEAITALRDRYPKLAAEIAGLLRQAVEADRAARAAGVYPGVEGALLPLEPGETPGFHTPFVEQVALPGVASRREPIWSRTMAQG